MVRIQLSEIISCIAENDFPEAWPNLIDDLLGLMSSSDFSTNLYILKTLHYIFKRYRNEVRSDELYTEINFVMSKFGIAFLDFYKVKIAMEE